MKSLLRATPFKMFMLLAGIPVAIFLIWFPVMAFCFINSNNSPFSHHNEDFGNLEMMITINALLVVVYVSLLMGWLYTLGIGLFRMTQQSMRPDIRLFKIAIVAPVVYAIFSVCLVSLFISQDLLLSFAPALIIFSLMRYLVLASVAYCAFVIARMLKSVELKQEVVFEQFAGEFFLLIFFPVGIWFLQPRIRILFDGYSVL